MKTARMARLAGLAWLARLARRLGRRLYEGMHYDVGHGAGCRCAACELERWEVRQW